MAYEGEYLRSWTRGWGFVISNFSYMSVDSVVDLGGDYSLEFSDLISSGEIGIIRYVDSDDELPDLLYAVTDEVLYWEWEEDDETIGTIASGFHLSAELSSLRDKFSGLRSHPPSAEDFDEDEEVFSLPGTGGPGTGLSTADNTIGALITSTYDALVLEAQSTEIHTVEQFKVSEIPSMYFGTSSTISGSSVIETIATPISNFERVT